MYTLNLKTSQGNLSIPQLGGSLTLSGRDSKWHVTDYDLGGTTLLYSTAEILTWKKFQDKTVLVVYSGPDEQHELAVVSPKAAVVLEGAGIVTKNKGKATTVNWKTDSTRRVVQIENLFIYILDRNTAYNYWVPDFARNDHWGAYASSVENTQSIIVQAGYLVRSVSLEGESLNIIGDLNATVPISIIGAPSNARELQFNGQKLAFTKNHVTGEWLSTLKYTPPNVNLPDLSSLPWKYVDNLPEIQSSYDDSAWTVADHTTTNNTIAPLLTPTSLFGSDYGYHTGVLIFRGWFTSKGTESSLYLSTQGGSAFGSSVFLNSTYIGSWPGIDAASSNSATYSLPNLTAGKSYVFTVLVDNNGLDENFSVGLDLMKDPRGILDFSLNGRDKSDIAWKLTGNLGAESYVDKVRGPLNEGGLYAERQGFTQPDPPNREWASGSPEKGLTKAGVAFYQTSFNLDLPPGIRYPADL